MMQVVPLLGLIGLIGLAGLAGLRKPVARERAGGGIRALGLLGLGGLAGFWIDGAGAMGAFGANAFGSGVGNDAGIGRRDGNGGGCCCRHVGAGFAGPGRLCTAR